ncbi:hypothetical protein [Yoonia sp.]|uniref:hypothetical protein n=1 Tax=Yoonia sp. TaxID=2212373 RepID=UPI002E0B6FC1|nr:hypothetical protein [Yoonia sp.]
MAIGSFVNGVFNGMQARDTMDNNKRLRKMDDTRFEREGETHGWKKESHEMAMERARKAAARSGRPKTPSRSDDFGTFMGGMDNGSGGGGYQGEYVPAPANRGMSAFGQLGGGAPLSYGNSAPREMSSLPAAQPQQVTQAMEFDFIPGQGLVPRGVA